MYKKKNPIYHIVDCSNNCQNTLSGCLGSYNYFTCANGNITLPLNVKL